MTKPTMASTKNSCSTRKPRAVVWPAAGNAHRMLAAPPAKTAVPCCATLASRSARTSGQYMPMSSRPATKAPRSWAAM